MPEIEPTTTLPTMDAFSPELAEHWLSGQAPHVDDRGDARRDDTPSPSQLEALEELAERVNAARSVY